MGKISKYSNLYDKDDKLILKAGTTVKQIQELIEQTKQSKVETTKQEIIKALKEVEDEGIAYGPKVQGSNRRSIQRSGKCA